VITRAWRWIGILLSTPRPKTVLIARDGVLETLVSRVGALDHPVAVRVGLARLGLTSIEGTVVNTVRGDRQWVGAADVFIGVDVIGARTPISQRASPREIDLSNLSANAGVLQEPLEPAAASASAGARRTAVTAWATDLRFRLTRAASNQWNQTQRADT